MEEHCGYVEEWSSHSTADSDKRRRQLRYLIDVDDVVVVGVIFIRRDDTTKSASPDGLETIIHNNCATAILCRWYVMTSL